MPGLLHCTTAFHSPAMHPTRHALIKRWSSLPPNVRGAAWMLIASLLLSAMAACVKIIGQTMSVWQVLVIRSLIALAFLLPALARSQFRAVITTRPFAHLARGLIGACAFV